MDYRRRWSRVWSRWRFLHSEAAQTDPLISCRVPVLFPPILILSDILLDFDPHHSFCGRLAVCVCVCVCFVSVVAVEANPLHSSPVLRLWSNRY